MKINPWDFLAELRSYSKTDEQHRLLEHIGDDVVEVEEFRKNQGIPLEIIQMELLVSMMMTIKKHAIRIPDGYKKILNEWANAVKDELTVE